MAHQLVGYRPRGRRAGLRAVIAATLNSQGVNWTGVVLVHLNGDLGVHADERHLHVVRGAQALDCRIGRSPS